MWIKRDKETIYYIKISLDFQYATTRKQAVKITQIPEKK